MSSALKFANPIRAIGSFRLGLVWRYTLMFSIITLTLMGMLISMLYQQSIGNLTTRQLTELEFQSVQQQQLADSMSRDEYAELIERHNRANTSILLVLENTSGSLSFIPDNLTICPKLHFFHVWNDDLEHIQKQQGCITKTSHGRLLVSLDTEPIEHLQNQFVSALIWVCFAGVMLSILLGRFFSSHLVKRLKEINRFCASLKVGKISSKQRLSISNRQDEFDITASHINQMMDAIENSIEQIEGVTDTIAHDLRTPLSRLRLKLESLEKKTKFPISEEISNAIVELDTVLSAFKSMLELTRLQNHQTSYYSKQNMTAIVNDAIEFAVPLFEAQKQTLKADIAIDCQVMGDADLLFRMCFNLLENCSKYAGLDANVTVTLHYDRLIVSDNGPGIPDEEMDKVLQRFYRADKSRGIPGYGLGLSFVQAVCRLHKMELQLSNNNPGLIVTISFNKTNTELDIVNQ